MILYVYSNRKKNFYANNKEKGELMNIAFFLTPKNEVVCEYTDATMRQVMEKMEYHGYTAIPLINKLGKYVGTLTEGDLLWKLKNTPSQNFVPVVDDDGIFIGIIKRSDIIDYCFTQLNKLNQKINQMQE